MQPTSRCSSHRAGKKTGSTETTSASHRICSGPTPFCDPAAAAATGKSERRVSQAHLRTSAGRRRAGVVEFRSPGANPGAARFLFRRGGLRGAVPDNPYSVLGLHCGLVGEFGAAGVPARGTFLGCGVRGRLVARDIPPDGMGGLCPKLSMTLGVVPRR